MKYIPYFILIIIIYVIIGQTFSKNYVIPNEAIRVRVIANSNEEYDQRVKSSVKDIVSKEMYTLLKNTNSIENARDIINSNISNLDKDIGNYLDVINYNLEYKLNFGYNYFPKKTYKGVEYKEGYYESLVVTLGEGEGDNWWCVLFPPVCMIEAEEGAVVEYTTLVKALMSKYLK